MGIPRVRIRGPEYHQPHTIGAIWAWDYGRGCYAKLTELPCVYTANSWVAKREMCSDETHPGPPWRSGGPLFIKRWFNPLDHGSSYVLTSPTGYFQYRGCFNHSTVWDSPEFPGALPDDSLGFNYGAKGWNKFRPTRSGADMGQFLAELKDFKSLFRVQLRSFKDLGSAYLNVQFGWKPFLNDIKKFYQSLMKVERTISFIRKNNNKWITRGGTIQRKEETGSPIQYGCLVNPILNGWYHVNTPISLSPTIATPVTRERIWFKARMKYYIPGLSVDKCENVLSSPLLRRIYGLEATPSLVWELTPWSWLVDWFGNVGDVMANLSNQAYDNLVAKYAYVMRTWEKLVFYNTNYQFDAQETSSIKLRSSSVLSTKQRAEASPFGFHLGWDDLSSYQLSILGALGLSRSPR